MPYLFFYIYLSYRFEYSFRKEVVNSFKSQIKYIIIVDIIHLYYTIVSNVVKFQIKVVFVIKIFFIVVSYGIEINSYNYEFFVFPLNAKYIYTFTLRFSDSSISEFSFTSISNTSKGIDVKTFPKLKGNSIHSIIITLYSIFTILTFF